MNWLLQLVDPANIGAFFTQFQADMQRPAFWLAVGKIIWINVLLSGDNALVIAMACRGLAPWQRLWGMVIGAGIAVVLLIAFTGIVATLMVLPYLKLAGGLALLVIAAKLLVPEDEGGDVIAVAAAANGQLPLLILGLAISIPMIIAGAALIMMVLDRLPILVWLGATLLGWIAGGVIATDPAVHPFLQQLVDGQIAVQFNSISTIFGVSPNVMLDGDIAEYICSVLGAIAVLAAGSIWRKRRLRHFEHPARPDTAEATQPIERR